MITNLTIGNLTLSNADFKNLELRNLTDNLGTLGIISGSFPLREKNYATKGYVDAAITGLTIKTIVNYASPNINIDLSTDLESGDPIDGSFILNVGDLVLIKDQIDQTENGIYSVNLQGMPSRISPDKLAFSQLYYVEEGLLNAGKVYQSNGTYNGTNQNPVYDNDPITFGTIDVWPIAPFGGTNGGGGTGSILIGPNKILGNFGTVSGPAVGVSLGTGLVLSPTGTLNLATSGTGTITNIATGTGLTGGPITSTGTISLNNTGVTAGTFGNKVEVPQLVVDLQGRITTISNVSIAPYFLWNTVNGTVQNVLSNNGYIASNTSLVELLLPETANVGDIMAVAGNGSGLWRLNQNPNQVIHYGYKDTTVGTAGYIESTYKHDYLELLCLVQNTEFLVKQSVGNFDIV